MKGLQSAVVLAQKPGDKTVTLSVSVTLEDGTNLSASETVAFKVPDFYFAVFYIGYGSIFLYSREWIKASL